MTEPMTPEDRAEDIVDRDDWCEWLGQGYYFKPETLKMHIAAEIRAAVAEEGEACARIVREVARRPRADHDVLRAACAAFDEAEAAIRARKEEA